MPEAGSVASRSHTSEVLFFTTPHCSICRQVRPTVKEVAGFVEGKVKFREIDCSQDPDIATNFDVKGVPTLIAFHGGEEMCRMVGSRSEDHISDVFHAASSGIAARSSLAPNDRALRLGIALVFGVAAALAGQPVLWVLAAGAAVSGLWDVIRP